MLNYHPELFKEVVVMSNILWVHDEIDGFGHHYRKIMCIDFELLQN